MIPCAENSTFGPRRTVKARSAACACRVQLLGQPFDDRLAIAAGEEPGLQALDIVRRDPLPERRARLRAQRIDQLGVGEGRRRALESDRAHLGAGAGGDPVGDRRAARAGVAAGRPGFRGLGCAGRLVPQHHGEADLGIEEALLHQQVLQSVDAAQQPVLAQRLTGALRQTLREAASSRTPRSPITSIEVTWTSVHKATTATTPAAARPFPSGATGRA